MPKRTSLAMHCTTHHLYSRVKRVYASRVFALEAHVDRLIHSAQLLGFELPFDADMLCQACNNVIKTNEIMDGYMRPVAWRGMGPMGVSARGTPLQAAIAARAWPSYFERSESGSVRLTVATWRRPNPSTAPVDAKASGMYMFGTLSKETAEDA